MSFNTNKVFDLIIIGGGQSALACAYYLRRTDLDYLILDNQEACGGSWLQVWDSLTLFSPAEHSSLPGWMMPKSKTVAFPKKKEVIDYLCRYEKRYKIPVHRPVNVKRVEKSGKNFIVVTNQGDFQSRTIISATGTWQSPFIPEIRGKESYTGKQLHSAQYQQPGPFRDQKLLIVGEGNTGAQLLAELSKVAKTSWATIKTPEYLPDDVDGRVLFNVASAKYNAKKKGEKFDSSKYNLGSIVVVPAVKDARQRNALETKGSFDEMYKDGVIWQDGTREKFDAIIWCTGFNYATDHLDGLTERDSKGRIETQATKAINVPGLWLVGYGGWTGFASATLIGVGRTARQTIQEIEEFLS